MIAEEETANGDTSKDTVTPEQIAEIVAKWTNIPVTRLMSTEKEKLVSNHVYLYEYLDSNLPTIVAYGEDII